MDDQARDRSRRLRIEKPGDNLASDIDNTISYQFHIQVQYKANELLLIVPAFIGCYANWRYTLNYGSVALNQYGALLLYDLSNASESITVSVAVDSQGAVMRFV